MFIPYVFRQLQPEINGVIINPSDCFLHRKKK